MSIGQRSDAEQGLHSQMEAQMETELTLLLNEKVVWRKIEHSGTSNEIYRGYSELSERNLILRVNEARQRLGVSRARELSILSSIEQAQVGPNLIGATHEWLLMPEYQVCSHPSSLDELLAIVTRLQRAPISRNQMPLWKIDYEWLWSQYAKAIEGHSNSHHLFAKLAKLKSTFANIPELPPALVHHDLHPGNLMLNNQQLVLIDWEYAGVGSPWVDILALKRHWGVKTESLAQLPLLAGWDLDAINDALAKTKDLMDCLNDLWSRLYQ